MRLASALTRGTIRSRIARNRESLGLILPNRYTTLSEEKTEYTQLIQIIMLTTATPRTTPYVTTVNGITADWDTEKAYWAFYIGEEYAQTGVDATEIVAGTTYTFAKTVSAD